MSSCALCSKNTKSGQLFIFAGYKAVGESVEKPLMYYKNNLEATMNLASVMYRISLQ